MLIQNRSKTDTLLHYHAYIVLNALGKKQQHSATGRMAVKPMCQLPTDWDHTDHNDYRNK